MNKKDKIINSTITLLKKDGYTNLSVQKICTQSGIAKGSFYTYFNQKNDVIDVIIISLISDVTNSLKKLNKSNDLESNLQKIIDIIYQYIENESTLIRETFEAYVISNRMNKWGEIYNELYNTLEILLFKTYNDETKMLTQIISSMIENSAEKTYIFNHYDERNKDLRQKLVFQSILTIIKNH